MTLALSLSAKLRLAVLFTSIRPHLVPIAQRVHSPQFSLDSNMCVVTHNTYQYQLDNHHGPLLSKKKKKIKFILFLGYFLVVLRSKTLHNLPCSFDIVSCMCPKCLIGDITTKHLNDIYLFIFIIMSVILLQNCFLDTMGASFVCL